MLSDSAIFIIGLCVSTLCVAFVVASVWGLREAGRDRPPDEPSRTPRT